MAHDHRSPVRLPYWPDSEDVLEAEYARIEYHRLQNHVESGDAEYMADCDELPDDATYTPFEDRFPVQLRDGAGEGDEDRDSPVRRRYYRQVDEFEPEDDYVYSPTSAPRRLQIEAAYTRGSPRMAPLPSEFTTSNDMIDQELEYRRNLVFEVKFGQLRLSVLSKPTAPGSRAGKGFLWLMLAVMAIAFLVRCAALMWLP